MTAQIFLVCLLVSSANALLPVKDSQHTIRKREYSGSDGPIGDLCVKELLMFHYGRMPTNFRQYQCRATSYTPGPKCISLERRCDGVADCALGDDEEHCDMPTLCPVDYMPCGVGQCIPIPYDGDPGFVMVMCNAKHSCIPEHRENFYRHCAAMECEITCGDRCVKPADVCDGYDHCEDKRDEEYNMCKRRPCPSGIKCETWESRPVCLSDDYICDGRSHCEDGADEDPEYCLDRPCPDGQTKCRNDTKCIDDYSLCNGYPDCPDGSDEDPEVCQARKDKCEQSSSSSENRGLTLQSKLWNDNDNDIRPMFYWDRQHSLLNGDNRCEELVSACSAFSGSLSADQLRKCANYSCNVNERAFQCKVNGNSTSPSYVYCVNEFSVCDGIPDCYDGEDEDPAALCTPDRPCFDSQFACGDGRCIPQMSVCDGVQHCSNNKDEEPSLCTPERVCPSGRHLWQCGDGQCIPGGLLCSDRSGLCKNGRDKTFCQYRDSQCPEGSFKCGRQCVSNVYKCSGGYVRQACSESVADALEAECKEQASKPCPLASQVPCGDGQCVEEDYVCSGILFKVCANGALSGDTFCASRKCREDQFSCGAGSGQCISMDKVCDGRVTHCTQTGRDEHASVCNKTGPDHNDVSDHTSPRLVIDQECQDSAAVSCHHLLPLGICQRFPAFSAQYCRRSCQLCAGSENAGIATIIGGLPQIPQPKIVINYNWYYNVKAKRSTH